MGLFEFDGPVGVIEEGLPASVFVEAEAKGDNGVAFGLGGFVDEFHVGLVGCSATFFAVTFNAAADEVCP